MNPVATFWCEDAITRASFAGRGEVTSADWDPRAPPSVRAAFQAYQAAQLAEAEAAAAVLAADFTGRPPAPGAAEGASGTVAGYEPFTNADVSFLDDLAGDEVEVVARLPY